MKNYTMGAVEANASAPHNLAQLGISYTIKDQSVCANGECVHVPLIDDTLCALRSSVLCIPSAPSISSATTDVAVAPPHQPLDFATPLT